MLDPFPVTSRGHFRIAGEADANDLSVIFLDEKLSRFVERFHVMEVAVAVENRQPFQVVAYQRAADFHDHRRKVSGSSDSVPGKPMAARATP